jgi:hypothetical protein
VLSYGMSTAPREFTLDSSRVRVQRFGTPRECLKAFARMGASLLVAAGLTALAKVVPVGEGVFIGVAILTVLAFALAVMALAPLIIIFATLGLGALLSRTGYGGISVSGRLFVTRGEDIFAIPLADVVAVDAHEPGFTTVRTDEGDVVRLEITDARQGADLAAAIGGGTYRGLWIAPLYAPVLPSVWPRRVAIALTCLAGLAAALFGHDIEGLAMVGGCVGLLLWITILRPRPSRQRVRVGADGVAIESDAGLRFAPFTSIERVEAAPYGAVLALSTGERMPLAVVKPTLSGAGERELSLLRRGTLLARLARGVEGVESLAGAERLGRQGRSIEAWRAAVRELVREDAPGYRAALLPTEQAVRIVESGHASPEARVGAALALAASADAGLKRRLRVVLDATADDSTRCMIVHALDDQLEPWHLPYLERARRT